MLALKELFMNSFVHSVTHVHVDLSEYQLMKANATACSITALSIWKL